jgi:hypothetical protein
VKTHFSVAVVTVAKLVLLVGFRIVFVLCGEDLLPTCRLRRLIPTHSRTRCRLNLPAEGIDPVYVEASPPETSLSNALSTHDTPEDEIAIIR